MKNILLSFIEPNMCVNCEKPLPLTQDENICDECIAGLIELKSPKLNRYELSDIVSCYEYAGEVKNLVHLFKYKNRRDIGVFFAQRMLHSLDEENITPTVVTFVPTFKNERDRFNQSQYLAKRIAKALNVPCEQLLVKKKKTISQTKCRSAAARQKNISDAFAPNGSSLSLEGQTVLVVDDVFTTGATLRACACPLLDCGADKVCAATFARTSASAYGPEIRFEYTDDCETFIVTDVPYDAEKLYKKSVRYAKFKKWDQKLHEILGV